MEKLKEIFTPVVYRMIKEKCTIKHYDDIEKISEIINGYVNLTGELDKHIDKNIDPIIFRALYESIGRDCYCKSCKRRTLDIDVSNTDCKYCGLRYCSYCKCKCCKQFIYTQCHICKKIDFMRIRKCISDNVCTVCQFICCNKCSVSLYPFNSMVYCDDCGH